MQSLHIDFNIPASFDPVNFDNHLIVNGKKSIVSFVGMVKNCIRVKNRRMVLGGKRHIRHISTDIIESDFGILKAKVSPNKLCGFTPMVLILPLYPKITVYSDAEKQNFKERLANVKLKDIDLWAKENLSPNRVTLRSKTLNKAS